MILSCPHCDARFQVPDGAIGASGRKVRCGACAHVWHEDGPEPLAARASSQRLQSAAAAPIAAPDAIGTFEDPDDDFDDVFDEDDDDFGAPAAEDGEKDDSPFAPLRDRSLEAEVAETMRRLREEPPAYGGASVPALRRRPNRWVLFGWVLWLLFIGGLVLGFSLYGQEIRAAWPASEKLYRLLSVVSDAEMTGETVTPPPTDRVPLLVRITDDPQWQAVGDGWTLIVTLRVTNSADVPVPPGALSLVLIDQADQPLRRHSVPLEGAALEPGESRQFTAEITDAPAETVGILPEWQEETKAP